jgi:hypothetical protein
MNPLIRAYEPLRVSDALQGPSDVDYNFLAISSPLRQLLVKYSDVRSFDGTN